MSNIKKWRSKRKPKQSEKSKQKWTKNIKKRRKKGNLTKKILKVNKSKNSTAKSLFIWNKQAENL